jgi:hypothetical protein
MAYNITVAPQLPEHFFRQNPWRVLIRCSLIPILMLSISDAIFEDLGHLNLATNPTQESFMDAFARETLHDILLNAVQSSTHTIVAQADVRLFDLRSTILLVLQADKTVFNASHPEPQVIEAVIAGYQNNEKRFLGSLSPLDAMTTLLHASLWLALDPSSILSLSPKLSCDWPISRSSNNGA